MENYIYLAEERINALYEQDGAGTYETSCTAGINAVGVISGENKVIHTDTLTERLAYVVSHIDTKANNVYIEANIPMAWNAKNRIRSDIKSTFWIGEIPAGKGQIYEKTYVLLIGSEKNIITNRNVTDFFISASYIDSFFKSIEDSFNDVTFQCHRLLESNNAEQDEKNIKAIAQKNDWTDEQKKTAEEYFLKEFDTNKYIEHLLDTYSGNYCEYEFLAQILSSSLGYNSQDELCRFIIAAPLYVALSNIITERVLYLPKKRKYVLTEKEYKAHKRNNFVNLHMLLLSSGLKKEESRFTAEMKSLFQKYGKHSVFSDKKKTAQFIDEAECIVEQFFTVVKDKNA